jgi:hypothetical protein
MIKVHDSREYIRKLDTVATGIRAQTHRALFTGNRHVFVKAYPKAAFRGLVNDVIGYLMAVHAGINQPEAGIIRLPYSLFDNPESLIGDGKVIECFTSTACADLTGRVCGNLFAFFGENSSLVQKALEGWHGFPKLVAFDAWISNVDRHIGNLLYVGPGQLMPIDHSDVLTGPQWTIANLVSMEEEWTANRLIDEVWPWQQLPDNLKSAMIASAEKFEIAYAKARVDLYNWLDDNDEFHRAHHFIWKRSSIAKNLMAGHMSMLI